MPTAAEVTDPLLWTYCTVIPAGEGVCDVCHGAPSPGFVRCYSCAQVASQVSHHSGLVVPISLSRWDGQLHHSLRSYKNSDYRQQTRDLFALQIAALFERFLVVHRSCISAASGFDWDVITVVPSSRPAASRHPLELALTKSPWIDQQLDTLLTLGPNPASHNQARDDAYLPTKEVNGVRVLIVDDTFTTGARAQSAVSVLTRAGAVPVAIVPAARYVNPDWEPSVALLERASSLSYSFEYCCVGNHALPPARAR